MCVTDTTTYTTTEASPVIDISLAKPPTVVVTVVAAIAAIIVVVPGLAFFKAIGFSPLAGWNPTARWMFLGLVLGSFVGLVLWGIRKWREEPIKNRAQHAVASVEHHELPRVVDRFCKNFAIETVLPARSICSALVGMGTTGLVFRSCLTAQRPAVEAIGVPFEPVPLDQSDGLFIGLEADTATTDASSAHTESRTTKTCFARRIEFFGGRWIVVLAGIGVVIQGLVHWLQGTLLSPTFMILVVCLLIPLVGIGGVGAWRHGRQWLLVPGGLAVRKANRKAKSKWDVRLYTRVSSVLFVRQTTKLHWLVCAAEGAEVDHVMVTRAEVDMLLRAWLSPLTPPPVEQLSDLE